MPLNPSTLALLGGPSQEESPGFLESVHRVVGAPGRLIDRLLLAPSRAAGFNIPEEATTGQVIASGLGLAQGDEGYAGRIGRRAVEFGVDVARDPLTYGMGALGGVVRGGRVASSILRQGGEIAPELLSPLEKAARAGRFAQPIQRGASAGFAALMGTGAVEEGGRALETLREEGLSPQAAEELFGTAVSGLGAAAGALHARAPKPREYAVLRERLPNLPDQQVQDLLSVYEKAERPDLVKVTRDEIARRDVQKGITPEQAPEEAALRRGLMGTSTKRPRSLEDLNLIVEAVKKGQLSSEEATRVWASSSRLPDVLGKRSRPRPQAPPATPPDQLEAALRASLKTPQEVDATLRAVKTPQEWTTVIDDLDAALKAVEKEPVDVSLGGTTPRLLEEVGAPEPPPSGPTPTPGRIPGGVAPPEGEAPSAPGVPRDTTVSLPGEVVEARPPRKGTFAMGEMEDPLGDVTLKDIVFDSPNDKALFIAKGNFPEALRKRAYDTLKERGYDDARIRSEEPIFTRGREAAVAPRETAQQLAITRKEATGKGANPDKLLEVSRTSYAERVWDIFERFVNEGVEGIQRMLPGGPRFSKEFGRSYLTEVTGPTTETGSLAVNYPGVRSSIRVNLPWVLEATKDRIKTEGVDPASPEAAYIFLSELRKLARHEIAHSLRGTQHIGDVIFNPVTGQWERSLTESGVYGAKGKLPGGPVAKDPTHNLVEAEINRTLSQMETPLSDSLLAEGNVQNVQNLWRGALRASSEIESTLSNEARESLNKYRRDQPGRLASLEQEALATSKSMRLRQAMEARVEEQIQRLREENPDIQLNQLGEALNRFAKTIKDPETRMAFKRAIDARVETARDYALTEAGIPPAAPREPLKATAPRMAAAAPPSPVQMDLLEKRLKTMKGLSKQKKVEIKNAARQGDQALFAAIQKAESATGMDKALEVWKGGLLSAPGTWFVQTADILESGARLGETALSGMLDKFFAGPRSRFSGETRAEVQGWMKKFPEAWATMGRDFREAFTLAPERVDLERPLEFQVGKVPGTPGRVVRLPFRVMNAAGRFLRDTGTAAELEKLALRKAKGNKTAAAQVVQEALDPSNKLHLELLKKARAGGKERVFEAEPGPMMNALLRMRNTNKWVHLVLPFLQVPGNITKLIAQRSPLGFVKAAKEYAKYKEALRSGDLSPDGVAELKGRAMDAIARPLLGTIVMAGFGGMALAGNMTGGGPVDKKKRNFLLQSGWQPYSFVIPTPYGKYYLPYKRFQPLGALLGFAADAAESTDEKEAGKVFERGLESLGQNLTSQTYLQGLADAMEFVSNPREMAGAYAGSLAGSAVPNIFAKAAQAIDPYVRETRPMDRGPAGVPETIARSVAARIPFVSEQLPPKISGTGEPIERPGVSITRLLSPVQPTFEEPEAPLVEFIAGTGAAPGLPSKTLTIQGVEVPLTEDEWITVAQANKQAMDYIAQHYMTNPSFQVLPQVRQKQYIERIFSQVRGLARQKLMQQPDFAVRARSTLMEAGLAGGV